MVRMELDDSFLAVKLEMSWLFWGCDFFISKMLKIQKSPCTFWCSNEVSPSTWFYHRIWLKIQHTKNTRGVPVVRDHPGMGTSGQFHELGTCRWSKGLINREREREIQVEKILGSSRHWLRSYAGHANWRNLREEWKIYLEKHWKGCRDPEM